MNPNEQYLAADATNQRLLRQMQQGELDDYYLYTALAKSCKQEENKKILTTIANDEMLHYKTWQSYTGKECKPNSLKLFFGKLMGKIMGFTFTIKKMETGELMTSQTYEKMTTVFPSAGQVLQDEKRHEADLLEVLDEERLQYVGSMVLGLNDALVELTGTIAGLTFALQSTRLVALSGLITGISATLSMASSEYLSARAEGDSNAMKSCMYTGIAYLITVALLVLPYLVLPDSSYALALGCMLVIVILIIFFFNYYISIAKSIPFKRRFLEMAGISLSVALISFIIGLLVKQFLGVDI